MHTLHVALVHKCLSGWSLCGLLLLLCCEIIQQQEACVKPNISACLWYSIFVQRRLKETLNKALLHSKLKRTKMVI